MSFFISSTLECVWFAVTQNLLFSGRVGTFKNIYSVPSRRMYYNTSAAITESLEAPVPLLLVARVQQLFPLPPFQREGGVVILSTGMQSDLMYGSYSPSFPAV